jgi:hypothetical protein
VRLCAFASSPNSTRLATKAQWVALDWFIAIQFTTHMLIIYREISLSSMPTIRYLLGCLVEHINSSLPLFWIQVRTSGFLETS